jgi:TctA family transporter
MTSPAFGLALSIIIVLSMSGAYDVYATFYLDHSSTVSYLLQSWAVQFPILPLLVGILLGHLFWPVAKLPEKH